MRLVGLGIMISIFLLLATRKNTRGYIQSIELIHSFSELTTPHCILHLLDVASYKNLRLIRFAHVPFVQLESETSADWLGSESNRKQREPHQIDRS